MGKELAKVDWYNIATLVLKVLRELKAFGVFHGFRLRDSSGKHVT